MVFLWFGGGVSLAGMEPDQGAEVVVFEQQTRSHRVC
jgi:hypothetical protein